MEMREPEKILCQVRDATDVGCVSIFTASTENLSKVSIFGIASEYWNASVIFGSHVVHIRGYLLLIAIVRVRTLRVRRSVMDKGIRK